MNKKSVLLLFVLLALLAVNNFAIQRFPKPEFESAYSQPEVQMPAARAAFMQYIDLAVLAASLCLITWFILRKRSRNGVFWISIFSILYFGFYRKGCICSVGSIQNITLGLFNPGYHIPITALAFFLLPMFFTLFFGRTFCAGVCPLGAIQDVFAIRPMKLNSRVESLLGLIPFIYLGLAVLYAATATDFIICRYDPFVGFFRINASFLMFAIGGLLLVTGVFIARPYCRFLCPYGVLLNLVSRFSKKHMSITPSECIDCRLCENACPFNAIEKPTQQKNRESRNVSIKRLIVFSVLIPFLMMASGWAGSMLHGKIASINPKVKLAFEMKLPPGKLTKQQAVNITTFRSSGNSIEKFNEEVDEILTQYYWGGWIMGAFIGLVFGLTLAGLSIPRYRTGYWPDKGSCLSCARCMKFCPVKPGMDKSQIALLKLKTC